MGLPIERSRSRSHASHCKIGKRHRCVYIVFDHITRCVAFGDIVACPSDVSFQKVFGAGWKVEVSSKCQATSFHPANTRPKHTLFTLWVGDDIVSYHFSAFRQQPTIKNESPLGWEVTTAASNCFRRVHIARDAVRSATIECRQVKSSQAPNQRLRKGEDSHLYFIMNGKS